MSDQSKKTPKTSEAIGVLDMLAETVDLEPFDLAETQAPTPSTRQTTGRLIEKGELGRGGLGVVVESFDVDLRRDVAVKRTRPDRTDAHSVIALVREAQITAQLAHPNIPAVHTLGIDDDGHPYFTMTRLRGVSLDELLRSSRTDAEIGEQLGIARKLRIFLQVAYAVAFAHSRGVLHRDIKPANVLIGAFGEVRLVDWGIAMLLTDQSQVIARDEPPVETDIEAIVGQVEEATRTGQFLGTPAYASPE